MKFKELHKAIKEGDLSVGDSFWLDDYEFEVKRNKWNEDIKKWLLDGMVK